MKIAVASNDKKSVSGHLGRCRGFLIYETDGTEIKGKTYLENTFTHHRMHPQEELDHEHHNGFGNGPNPGNYREYGYGPHHEHEHGHSHQNLMDALEGCSALIFQSGGWRIIEDLQANNITPILTDESIADDAVKKFLKGELVTKEDNSCDHH